MTRTLLLFAFLLLALPFALRAAAADSSAPQEPGVRVPEVILRGSVQTPVWDTFQVEDDVPARLRSVPAGKRFVLTDLWLLSHERLPVGIASADRMWLECVSEGTRKVVFDSAISELVLPLRWETGVAFTAGQ